MADYYFDTSALVKRYKAERGTPEVKLIVESALRDGRLWIAELTWVEITSAVVRAVRGGRIPAAAGEEMLTRFRSEILATPYVWPVSEQTIIHAVKAVEQYGLRAADAVQLAALLEVKDVVGESLAFVVSDAELARAAVDAGVGEVITPGLPGFYP